MDQDNQQQNRLITPEVAKRLRQEAQDRIKRFECLTRLKQNSDFKEVMEFYMEDHAIMQVHLLADPSQCMVDNREANRTELLENMIGIARLSLYFRAVEQMAMQAQNTLNDLNEAEARYHEETMQ